MSENDAAALEAPERRRSDLLSRRRRETEREIAEAALDLFEQQGVAHTTVEQIAERAGISPRTFFRYSSSKEAAVCLDDMGVDEALETAFDSGEFGEDPVATLEEVFARNIAELDEENTANASRVLRARKLFATEPLLTQTMLRADIERGERITERLAEALGTSPNDFRPRAITAVLHAATRITFDEWSRRVEAGEHPSIARLYAEAREAVTAAATR